MITRIYAKNFKGLDFDVAVDQLNLTTGIVGSGKSARTMAICFLVTGTIPGSELAKQAGDIFTNLCSADEMIVGAQISGKTLERKLSKTKTGTIRTTYFVDGANCPKNLFDIAVHDLGIKVADLGAFNAMSDSKKVAHLFDLYPPDGDITGLNKVITEADEKANKCAADAKSSRQTAQTLQKSIVTESLPASTLPRIQADIVAAQDELKAVEDELRMIRDQEIAEKAKAEVRAEAQTSSRTQPTMTPTTPAATAPVETQQEPQQRFKNAEVPPCQDVTDMMEVLLARKVRKDFEEVRRGTEQALKVMERLTHLQNVAATALLGIEGIQGVLHKQECGSQCPASMKCKVEIRKLMKMSAEVYS
jgi:hypothetical protein